MDFRLSFRLGLVFQRLGIFFTLLTVSLTAQGHAPVRIAVAADMQQAMLEINQAFQQSHPNANILISYSASGVITSQLRQGAPFQLFLSANAEYPEILYKQGLTYTSGTPYALGRIAFLTYDDIQTDTAIHALQIWQQNKRPSERLAIANPLHAPNGIMAMDWLRHWGMQDILSKDLVYGENAAQSVQFVLSGATSSGIVAWPLIANRNDFSGRYWLIPENEHITLPRHMVLLKGASEAAFAFYDFMLTEQASTILKAHGFGVP